MVTLVFADVMMPVVYTKRNALQAEVHVLIPYAFVVFDNT
jgi:hypothetical protein